MCKPYVRLDKNNAAVLLVDHQAGLLSLVRDIDPDRFKNNVLALADAAEHRHIRALRNVDPDLVSLSGSLIIVFERAPEPASFDADDRIGQRIEIGRAIERGEGDVIGLDAIGAALQRFLNNI